MSAAAPWPEEIQAHLSPFSAPLESTQPELGNWSLIVSAISWPLTMVMLAFAPSPLKLAAGAGGQPHRGDVASDFLQGFVACIGFETRDGRWLRCAISRRPTGQAEKRRTCAKCNSCETAGLVNHVETPFVLRRNALLNAHQRRRSLIAQFFAVQSSLVRCRT